MTNLTRLFRIIHEHQSYSLALFFLQIGIAWQKIAQLVSLTELNVCVFFFLSFSVAERNEFMTNGHHKKRKPIQLEQSWDERKKWLIFLLLSLALMTNTLLSFTQHLHFSKRTIYNNSSKRRKKSSHTRRKKTTTKSKENERRKMNLLRPQILQFYFDYYDVNSHLRARCILIFFYYDFFIMIFLFIMISFLQLVVCRC